MATAARTATGRKATAGPANGRVIQITGAVVDIEFPAGKLPGIYNAVVVMATLRTQLLPRCCWTSQTILTPSPRTISTAL